MYLFCFFILIFLPDAIKIGITVWKTLRVLLTDSSFGIELAGLRTKNLQLMNDDDYVDAREQDSASQLSMILIPHSLVDTDAISISIHFVASYAQTETQSMQSIFAWWSAVILKTHKITHQYCCSNGSCTQCRPAVSCLKPVIENSL